MQISSDVAALYAQPGPFATAFFDATRSSEQGAEEVRLRWQALREQIAAAGADDSTLNAMDERVGGHRDVPGPHGQLVVAAGGRVLLDLVAARAPAQPVGRWSALPHVMPFLAHTAPQVPHVIVAADRTGADIATVSALSAAQGGAPTEWDSVSGGAYPIHRTGRNTWDERQFQNRVENSWADNARTVAGEVAEHVAAIGAEVVVITGDEHARSLLMRDLPHALPSDVELVDSSDGGRGAGASAEALDDAVNDAILRHVWRERRAILERLQQGIGRHDYGLQGIPAVLDALRKSQVDTLILSDDPSSTAMAWVGPEPLQLALTEQELRDLGVAQPQQDRLDAALVRALAGSAAQILITPDAHSYITDGIAALLRYTDASTPA